MTRMLLQTIEQIGREKNIAPEVIVEAVEEAMAVASKKYYKTEEELTAILNRETGELEVYAIKEVVSEVADGDLEISVQDARGRAPEAEVGDFVEVPRSTDELGRIAAQAAKQVIFQKVRDAERENIYNEFIERTGELVTGIVKRFERGDMVVDLGRTVEGIVPRREQSRAEHYNIGDRIRVVIIDVLKATRGPQIVVSRVDPELLIRLFEMEVPEIYDGTVVIKGCVREGGDRAKVAVHSLEADVDPVGACVGMRGSRVQSIIRELRGEKIDIVQWSPDLQQYAINSLKPARVNRVGVLEEDGDDRLLEVVVDEDQLSLAIGKRGQNVRLAGKLLGCKIDIKSEEDKRKDVERALARMEKREDSVELLPGVGPQTAEALVAAGFATLGDVADADPGALQEVPGVGEVTAENLRESVEALLAEAAAAAVPPEEPEEPEPVTPAAPGAAEAPAEEESAVPLAVAVEDADETDAGTSAEATDEAAEAEEPAGGPPTEDPAAVLAALEAGPADAATEPAPAEEPASAAGAEDEASEAAPAAGGVAREAATAGEHEAPELGAAGEDEASETTAGEGEGEAPEGEAEAPEGEAEAPEGEGEVPEVAAGEDDAPDVAAGAEDDALEATTAEEGEGAEVVGPAGDEAAAPVAADGAAGDADASAPEQVDPDGESGPSEDPEDTEDTTDTTGHQQPAREPEVA